MDISVRSYLSAGVSLTAATAIAFTPLVIPVHLQPVPIPHVTVAELQLAVSPADIALLTADIQGALDEATATVAASAGVPGKSLIGVVNNIVTLLDTVFTGLIDATTNQTLAASLTILRTLSVDAFAKLAENLGLINPVIITTTAQVGELLTSALTGSLQNILVAVAKAVDDPLSLASYAELFTAGVASGQLLAGNSLEAIQSMGDGAFDIAGIALSEVTFQFNNAVSGLSALLTQLGDASDNTIVEAVIRAVQGLAIAPAVAVFNFGSDAVGTVLRTANTGFDLLFGGAPAAASTTLAAPPETMDGSATAADVIDDDADVSDEVATPETVPADLDSPVAPVVDSLVADDAETISPTSADEAAAEEPVADTANTGGAASHEGRKSKRKVGEDDSTVGDKTVGAKTMGDKTMGDKTADDGGNTSDSTTQSAAQDPAN